MRNAVMPYKSLLDELASLNLPIDQYCIIGSGPLVIRGIRETKDIDILVTDQLWDELIQKYPTFDKNGFTHIRVSENIEVHGNKSFPIPSGEDPTQEENIEQAEVIDGFPFQNTKHFLYYKYKYKSEKELNDAKLLEEWLGRQG